MTTPVKAPLLEVAANHLHIIETLETRNKDRLGFHDVAIRAALYEAYAAGLSAAAKCWRIDTYTLTAIQKRTQNHMVARVNEEYLV